MPPEDDTTGSRDEDFPAEDLSVPDEGAAGETTREQTTSEPTIPEETTLEEPSTMDGHAASSDDDASASVPLFIANPHGPTMDQMPEPRDVSLKAPLLALLGPIMILTVGSILFPETVYDLFVYRYYWEPIVTDGGFNNVNTASWAVLMGLLLFLLDRLVKKMEQPMTFAVILAVVPYIVGGSIVRVLEDTKLFAEPLRFFFITPIIYVVITAVAVIWLALGHTLRKHADQVGLDGALKGLGAFLGAVWVAYVAWAFLGDDLVVFDVYGREMIILSSITLLLCLAVPYAIFWADAKRKGRFDQVGVMAVFGIAFLLFSIYFMLAWLSGQQWGLKAGTEPVAWIYAAMVLAPAAFTWGVIAYARRWAMGLDDWVKGYRNAMSILIGLFLLYQGSALTGIWRLGDVAHDRFLWMGVAFVIAPFVFSALFGIMPAIVTWYQGRNQRTPAASEDNRLPIDRLRDGFLPFLVPINLLLIFSQTMDGTMTALGIDQFGYSEKHVLPGFLIDWVAGGALGPLSAFPATVVMIPIKFLVALLVVWAVDVWARDDMIRHPNLVMLAKMAIVIVGLAPGTRNAVRLAMQV